MFEVEGLLIGLACLLNLVNTKVVSTTTGSISGVTLNLLGQDVNAYLGIPFAEPPVGELRFKPPIPVNCWDGTYNAAQNPPSCMQPHCPGNCSEDCLYLNIWTPSKTDKTSVMVWFYGGGFLRGSISEDIYNGSVIAALGKVIVISINYRLGSFGFFYSGTDDARGNMGMKDQVLGLRWVKKNIESFGGDPSSITIFGQSAGSVSVATHLVSPLTKGLFSSAIMQSGTAYIPNIVIRNASLTKWRSTRLAVQVGCAYNGQDISSDTRVMSCMRNMTASSLVDADFSVTISILFGPESPWLFMYAPLYGDDYLPNPPLRDLVSGNINADNVMVGNTKDEGSYFLALFAAPYLKYFDNPSYLFIRPLGTFSIRVMFRESDEISPDDVIKYYLRNAYFIDSSVLKSTYSSVGDAAFACPNVFLAEISSYHRKNVYFYNFTHRWSNSKNAEWMGVVHGDDLKFVFGVPFRNESSFQPEEKEFSREVIGCWTSFAKEGRPNYGRYSDIWLPYSRERRVAVNLNVYTVSLDDPYKEACNFWEKYLKINR